MEQILEIRKEMGDGVVLKVTHNSKFGETEISQKDGNDPETYVVVKFNEIPALIAMLERYKEVAG